MHILLTTCTAAKRTDATPLPAVERYLDPRMDHAVDEAVRHGLRLMIFSGVFGLLDASDPIPWYDHALAADEVDAAAEVLAECLVQEGISAVSALLEGRSGPGWAPYHDALAQACVAAGVALTVWVWDPTVGAVRPDLGAPPP